MRLIHPGPLITRRRHRLKDIEGHTCSRKAEMSGHLQSYGGADDEPEALPGPDIQVGDSFSGRKFTRDKTPSAQSYRA